MRVTDEMVEAAETPMSDHIASFWRLLEKEHVRILIEMRRETSNMTYWDSSSFSDDVAKALVADRRAALAEEGAEAEPVAWIWPDAFERLRRGDSPRETVHADTYMRGAIPLYTTPPAGIREALAHEVDCLDSALDVPEHKMHDEAFLRASIINANNWWPKIRAALRGQS